MDSISCYDIERTGRAKARLFDREISQQNTEYVFNSVKSKKLNNGNILFIIKGFLNYGNLPFSKDSEEYDHELRNVFYPGSCVLFLRWKHFDKLDPNKIYGSNSCYTYGFSYVKFELEMKREDLPIKIIGHRNVGYGKLENDTSINATFFLILEENSCQVHLPSPSNKNEDVKDTLKILKEKKRRLFFGQRRKTYQLKYIKDEQYLFYYYDPLNSEKYIMNPIDLQEKIFKVNITGEENTYRLQLKGGFKVEEIISGKTSSMNEMSISLLIVSSNDEKYNFPITTWNLVKIPTDYFCTIELKYSDKNGYFNKFITIRESGEISSI